MKKTNKQNDNRGNALNLDISSGLSDSQFVDHNDEDGDDYEDQEESGKMITNFYILDNYF